MKLNEKILYYRKAARMSQEELAARVGVSRQAVSKWELGDAAPDINKLLALARAFGVTTDELLSEEPPAGAQTEERPEPGEASAAPPREPASGERPPDTFDRSVGLLGRLIRRYGWLAGVRVALSGLGITLVGALARFMFGQMFRISLDAFNGLGGFGGLGGVTIEGAEGLPPELADQIIGALGGSTGGFGGMSAGFGGIESAFLTFATVILLVGLAVTAAGVILAIYLYKKGGGSR